MSPRSPRWLYHQRMNRRIALAAAPLILLAACSSGGGSSEPSSSTTSSSSVERDATYKDAAAVKDALVASGAQACDEWKPVDSPSHESFTTEGWCGPDVRIVTVKDDEFARASATVDMMSDDVAKALKDPQAAAESEPQYVRGTNWIVQVPNKTKSAIVINYLGGENVAASLATPSS